MFKVIAFIFLLLTGLIFYQVGESIYPDYQTRQYIQTQGTVLSTQIYQDKQRFQVVIEYIFTPDVTTYHTKSIKRLINNTYTNSFSQAQEYSSLYVRGGKINVYFDYQNPSLVKLDIGLSTEEYTKLLFLLPIILASILCFILAYIDEWSLFSSNNAMGAGSLGLFLSLLCASVMDSITYFYFDMILTPALQIIFISSCIAIFFIGFVFRKINHRDIFMDDKYKRLYNTQVVKQREEEPVKHLFYRFKKYCVLPLSILNGGLILIGLFLFYQNETLSSNHIIFLISASFSLSTILLLFLLKREKHYTSHSTTFN